MNLNQSMCEFHIKTLMLFILKEKDLTGCPDSAREPERQPERQPDREKQDSRPGQARGKKIPAPLAKILKNQSF